MAATIKILPAKTSLPVWVQGLFVVALAAVLRLYSLGRQPIWCDEYYTWRWVTLPNPISVILHVLAADIYPPLYQVLTWFVVRIDDSPVYLRFFSALGGIGAAFFIWLIGQRFFNARAALAAGIVAALSPLGIYYSQEAKFYSFFAGISLWMLYEFLRLLDKPESGPWRFALLVALASYTSFLTPYLVAPLVIVCAVLARRGQPSLAWLAVKGLLIGEALALPMLPFFIKGIATFQQGLDDPRPILWLPLFTAQNFSLAFWPGPAVSTLAASIFGLGIVGLWRLRKHSSAWALGSLALFALLPPVLNILSAISKPVYSDRAILACAYAWVGAAVFGLWAWPRPLRWAALGAIIALQLLALKSYYDPAHPIRTDFKPPYEAMKTLWKPGEAVFHGSINSLYAFKYLAHRDTTAMPNWIEIAAPQMNPHLSSYQKIWRQAKAWLENVGYPVDAGMEKSRVWTPRLETEALQGVDRFWFVQMDEATQQAIWAPQLNIVRTGHRMYKNQPMDPLGLEWIRAHGYKKVSQVPLAPGFQAFLFERENTKKP